MDSSKENTHGTVWTVTKKISIVQYDRNEHRYAQQYQGRVLSSNKPICGQISGHVITVVQTGVGIGHLSTEHMHIYEIGVYHESLTIAIYRIRAGYMNTFICKYGLGQIMKTKSMYKHEVGADAVQSYKINMGNSMTQ